MKLFDLINKLVILSTSSVIFLVVPPVTAWFQEVHNQIGFTADLLLTTQTAKYVSVILENRYNGSLGMAAAWADSVRRTTHPYSYGWHFISAKDNPPDDCGLYYHRDCQVGGCLVQQISNQTDILESCLREVISKMGTKLDPSQKSGLDWDSEKGKGLVCSEALKFVAHFVGEVNQPLHTSERSFGGNAVKVVLNGSTVNLHEVWDRYIIYDTSDHPNGFSATKLDPYFQTHIYGGIMKDSFRTPRSEWNMCGDLDARRGTYCVEKWAKESNALVCDYVYGKLDPKNNKTDLLLESDYVRGAAHIVEEQLAKGAWRLSGWLNSLVGRVVNEVKHDLVQKQHQQNQQIEIGIMN